jgi:nicotinamidase-related amidase
LHTTLDLLEAGFEVHVVADAIGSRRPIDREIALHRLDRAGATLTTVEAALLELCERAGTPEFKAVQKVIL